MKPRAALKKPTAVFHQSGAMQPGYGKVTGVVAFALSGMAVLSVFRPGWQIDFTHFIVNHLLVGLALVIVNFAIHRLFGWLVWPPLQKWIGGLPFFAELFGVLLVADLVQYWTHRAYHEIPFL